MSSFVLTYPDIDTLDVDQVLRFYDQPNEFDCIQSLNETCTDAKDKPFNLNGFRLKVQELAQGKDLQTSHILYANSVPTSRPGRRI